MKTLIRSLLLLSLIVWLGAEIFFPMVAAVTFTQLRPNTHAAGLIVGELLRLLHVAGMVAGVVLLALLALAPAWGIFKPRSVLAPMGLVLVMVGLTAYSQFGIIPSMEKDRIAAGGVVDAVPLENPARVHFERLHKRSVNVEGAVTLLGLAVVVLVAYGESAVGRT
jgi:tellurite resistance protein TehA-like permease